MALTPNCSGQLSSNYRTVDDEIVALDGLEARLSGLPLRDEVTR